MTRKRIYVVTIPRDAQTGESEQARRNIAQNPSLMGGSASVESVSVEAGDRTIRGEYRGYNADVLARQAESLFNAGHIEYVAAYAVDSNGNLISDSINGYYSLQDISTEPLDPRNDEKSHYRFDGTLVRKGTRQDYWRAVTTKPKQVEGIFGNDTTAYIGIPQSASKLRWFNPMTLQREGATIAETRDTEFGKVEIIDAQAASFDNPTAIYELPYTEEGKVDTKVWDTRGESKTATVDGDTVVEWERTFTTEHEWDGNAVISNAILRLEFDEGDNAITAEQWDSGSSSYSSVSLGASDWELLDFDLTVAGDERAVAQIEFRDPTQSPTEYYVLNMTLRRGAENAQWVVPPNESKPAPSGLKTLLDPIGSAAVVSADETRTLLSRKEVRK